MRIQPAEIEHRMSAPLTLNLQLPEIREWCPVCRAYEQHANGALQVPVPLGGTGREINVSTVPSMPTAWRSATQCLRCTWVTIYR